MAAVTAVMTFQLMWPWFGEWETEEAVNSASKVGDLRLLAQESFEHR